MITEAELSTLIHIFAAHLLADFFLQPHSWIEGRRKFGLRSRHLYLHISTVGLLTWVFISSWSAWPAVLFITTTHFLIDWWKSSQDETTLNFVIDQLGHFTMILIGWLWYIGYPLQQASGFLSEVAYDTELWIILCSYLIALRPTGFLIAKITSRWQRELQAESANLTGLKEAGTWIGYIERVIILTFILLNQYSAIGFLIAAKSIFRFSGGMKDKAERKHAEYILIGTLISFSLAILLGIATLSLLNR